MYASQQADIDMLPGISLEPEAFSWLRSLTLYDFGPHTTLSIVDRLASTAELTQLTLEINHNTDNRNEGSNTNNFYNSVLIPTICVRTPRLTHLSIRPMWNDQSHVEIDNSSLQLLASLCLKSFTLTRSYANIEYLIKLFPRVQTLRWPDHPVTLKQLRQFAKCHQLEHLSVKLDLSPSDMMEPLRDRAVPPATPCVLESDYGNLDLLSHAGTKDLLVRLARIWARPLVLQQAAPFDYPHCDFTAKRRLEELNKELERIRQAIKT